MDIHNNSLAQMDTECYTKEKELEIKEGGGHKPEITGGGEHTPTPDPIP